ncbi:MAG: hypothetical protein ACHQHK_13560 [Dongiales bacterium]
MLPFWLSIAVLSLVQAALVAAPRAASMPRLEGLRSSWWALVLPLSIVVVISAIALDSAAADLLSYLALVAVPPLFALAWAAHGSLGGEAAALALSALACATLGWLLVCVVPGAWVRLGIYAMAAIDTWLVASDLLQGPNAVLNTASPGAGLPRLQFVSFGSAAMGFGDIFIAAVLGALLARDRRLQLTGAALAACLCLGFDLLFLAVDELPATVPIALTLALMSLREAAGRG